MIGAVKTSGASEQVLEPALEWSWCDRSDFTRLETSKESDLYEPVVCPWHLQ